MCVSSFMNGVETGLERNEVASASIGLKSPKAAVIQMLFRWDIRRHRRRYQCLLAECVSF